MKILKVTHGFPPDEMAGAEIYAFNLAREMLRRRDEGVEVVVLSPGRRPEIEEYGIVEENFEGVRVLRLNNNYRALHSLESTYADPAIEQRFREVLEREKPDLVHLHHTIGTTANSAGICRAQKIPVVLTLHDFWFHCARGQRITLGGHICEEVQPWRCSLCVGKKRGRYGVDWMKAYAEGKSRDAEGQPGWLRTLEFLPRTIRQVWREAGRGAIDRRLATMAENLDACDLILAPSEFIGAEYVKRGVPADRVRFSEYGMDHSRFEGYARAPRAEGAPVRFGYTGTLLASKGVEELIAAFQKIPEGLATLDLYGAAGGPDPQGYEAKLAAMNRHPGLTFRGRFDNRRIAEVLSGMDVLCVPSRWWENAPLTLHEAAMAEIAVIATGHGGMAEFVERFGNGLTFEPRSVDSLAAAMRRFVEEPDLLAALASPKRSVRSVEDDVRELLATFRRMIAEDSATEG